MQTKRPFLIGLTGKVGVGKDTVANMLETPSFHYAFARPLKNMLAAIGIYEPPREKKEMILPRFGFSYRQAAQRLGTEWGRELNAELWLLLAQIEWEKRRDPFMILTDVRFENEAQWCRENGIIVHIHGRETTADADAQKHASESGLFVWPEDWQLYNGGSLDELRQAVRELAALARELREKQLAGT